MFAESNADHWRGAVCDGCGLPIGSCICSGTPWDQFTPAYYFAVTEPPVFWRKKDRDEWHRKVDQWTR